MCYLLKYQSVEIIQYHNVPDFGGNEQSIVINIYINETLAHKRKQLVLYMLCYFITVNLSMTLSTQLHNVVLPTLLMDFVSLIL